MLQCLVVGLASIHFVSCCNHQGSLIHTIVMVLKCWQASEILRFSKALYNLACRMKLLLAVPQSWAAGWCSVGVWEGSGHSQWVVVHKLSLTCCIKIGLDCSSIICHLVGRSRVNSVGWYSLASCIATFDCLIA